MQQFNKFRGTKGFISIANYMLRFRDMITQEAQRKVTILTFWERHGLLATKEAFGVSRPTLFRWQKALEENGGKLEALNSKSRAPKKRRRRIIPLSVEHLILEERSHECIGKEKLSKLIKEDGVGTQSASTVGRMLGDLKKRGRLPDPKHLSLHGKTGKLVERTQKQGKPKLRSKGHKGALVKADTVVRFTNGIKRYVVTAIDLESEFAFAYGYTSHSSQATADFMRTFKHVAPVTLTHVQTDNGSEFYDHFEMMCTKEGITHFYTYPRSPKMNAEVERFNRTLSEAFISKHRHLLAYNLKMFNRKLMDWLVWYNTRRPHWSIGLISPLRYICNKVTTKESHMLWTSTSGRHAFFPLVSLS